jgi:hypothetical protein
MTVAELLSRISAEELSEWVAFDNLKDEQHKKAQLAAKALSGVNKKRKL